jgi:hypothetical protein
MFQAVLRAFQILLKLSFKVDNIVSTDKKKIKLERSVNLRSYPKFSTLHTKSSNLYL